MKWCSASVIRQVLAEKTAPQATEGLERLRARMEDMRKSVSKKREQVSAAKTPVAGRIAGVLKKNGFPVDLAEELGAGVQSRCRDGKQDILGGLRAELNARVRVATKPGTTVALVGPAGVGKTTMLVKLAIAYGISKRRPVRLISTDTHRLGGTDLLRRYAEAMGVTFEAPATLELLQHALQKEERGGLTLIDTPGLSANNFDSNATLGSFLAKTGRRRRTPRVACLCRMRGVVRNGRSMQGIPSLQAPVHRTG